MADNELQVLENKIDELIALCDQLNRENQALKADNAGWQGERSSLKFVSFSGDEESQLAFLAVDPDTLNQNRRFNPLTPEERDDFGQDFAQLKYTRGIGDDTLRSASCRFLRWTSTSALAR